MYWLVQNEMYLIKQNSQLRTDRTWHLIVPDIRKVIPPKASAPSTPRKPKNKTIPIKSARFELRRPAGDGRAAASACALYREMCPHKVRDMARPTFANIDFEGRFKDLDRVLTVHRPAGESFGIALLTSVNSLHQVRSRTRSINFAVS